MFASFNRLVNCFVLSPFIFTSRTISIHLRCLWLIRRARYRTPHYHSSNEMVSEMHVAYVLWWSETAHTRTRIRHTHRFCVANHSSNDPAALNHPNSMSWCFRCKAWSRTTMEGTYLNGNDARTRRAHVLVWQPPSAISTPARQSIALTW